MSTKAKKVCVVTTEVNFGGEALEGVYATKEAALEAWHKLYPHMVEDGYVNAPCGLRGLRYIASITSVNQLIIYIYEVEVM